MPTFTSSREATKDEMAREIDRCHAVIATLEAALARATDRALIARAIQSVNPHGMLADLYQADAVIAAIKEGQP